jgi:L-ascorbate metabolism protein UlaG (beta-lactamase superfamily)
MSDMHMNPAEAVRAFTVSGAEFALGHHYGTFQLTDEAIDAPVQALETARVEAGIDPERFRLLRPGQVWNVEARAVA